MKLRRWITSAALGALTLLLVVLGTVLRPLFISETSSPPTVLDAIEIGFIQDMTAHHQQALVMVQRLRPDVDPTVSRLAQQIADTQRVEIGMMLGWLRLAGAAPTNANPMAWMHTSGQHPTTTMPGMASLAELDALSAAHGRDAEVLFLQLMQRHHYGGIAMAQAVDDQLAGGPVTLFARDMINTQSQETGMIGLLLTRTEAS